jgi:ribosomal protein S18 acetylase RimI-like enzyme
VVTIRAMVPEDIPRALALWQGLGGIGLRGADSLPALTRYLQRNPGMSFVAISGDGKLVGVSLAGHDGRRGFLHHVAVAPPYQRNGIGRNLVGSCLDALKASGIEKVNLWVKADNEEGLAFWKRLGGQERSDIVMVSIITGNNSDA